MSTQYVYHEINILLTYILTLSFQFLLQNSRPMISCHVTHHVTMVTCLFVIQKKRNQINKIKIKYKSSNILFSSISTSGSFITTSAKLQIHFFYYFLIFIVVFYFYFPELNFSIFIPSTCFKIKSNLTK